MRIRSLTARFVLTLLLSTALPFLVFGVIVRVGMRERLEAQVVRVLLANQSALLAKELDGLTASIYRDTSLIELAARKLLADGDVNAFERELDLLPGFQSDFQVVLVADAHGEVRVTIPIPGEYRAEIIDTWNMTITPVKGVFNITANHRYRYNAEGMPTVKLPGRKYMALRVQRVE